MSHVSPSTRVQALLKVCTQHAVRLKSEQQVKQWLPLLRKNILLDRRKIVLEKMLLKTQRRSLYLHQKSTPNSPFSLVTPHVFSIQRELRVSKVRLGCET